VNASLDMLNWAFLFIALTAMALLLRALSRRLGDALHMKKYYFLYDASIIVYTASAVIMILSYPEGALAVPARLLFLCGGVLMVGTTIRYWGWIIPEILKPGK
jgi:hypothetical protein